MILLTKVQLWDLVQAASLPKTHSHKRESWAQGMPGPSCQTFGSSTAHQSLRCLL